MNYIIIGAVIYFAIIITARFIGERAMKHLSDQNKLDLVDKFKSLRKYYLYAVLTIVVLFILISQVLKVDVFTSYIIFIAAFAAAMGFFTYMSYTILKQNNFPEVYIKSFLLARGLGLMALLALIVFVFAEISQSNG